MGESLIIVTRVLGGSGREEIWSGKFPVDINIAFVSNDCVIFENPTEDTEIPLIVISGGITDNDIVSNVINIVKRRNIIGILVHPGGGRTLKDIESNLMQRIRIEQNIETIDDLIKERKSIWENENWKKLWNKACTYSLRGGSIEEQNIGKVIESIAFYINKNEKEKFNVTVKGLLKSFREAREVEDQYERNKKLAELLDEKEKNKNIFINEKPEKMIMLIKNRITQLWLSLDIDLIGIEEVEDKNAQVKYLKEVLEEKRGTIQNGKSIYYRQKLVNLRYAIAGSEDESKIDGISVNHDFDSLIKQSLKDVISPEIREQQEWGILNELVGLEQGKPKHIIEFMKTLDDKILKIENVDRSDVIDILDFFKNKNWKIEGANPENIKSFHDWLCALDDCMDRLKNIIRNKSGDQTDV